MLSLPPLSPSSLDLTAAASQAVRDYCGWHVTPCVSQELVLDGTGHGKIFLPTKRLKEVHRLEVDGQAVTDFRFSEDGWITLSCGIFPRKERVVKVEIHHGFEAADPAAVVVGNIVARAKMSPTGTVIQQRAGTQSVTFASSGGQVVGFGLLEAEKQMLAPYRLEWGPQ